MKRIDEEILNLINSERVQEFLDQIYLSKEKICPKRDDVFRSLYLCPLSQTKVVIFGQDPYYQEGVADGLAFSTQNKRTPESLKNIFKEIETESLGATFSSNDLSSWAKQGVLLLNTSLTVVESKPNIHKDYWLFFIKEIINIINSNLKNIIFVLWGNEAKKLKKLINSNQIILLSSHPSPLSASKGFFGNNHFKKINDILLSQSKEPIDWSTS